MVDEEVGPYQEFRCRCCNAGAHSGFVRVRVVGRHNGESRIDYYVFRIRSDFYDSGSYDERAGTRAGPTRYHCDCELDDRRVDNHYLYYIQHPNDDHCTAVDHHLNY